jgi:hypothetical protein
VAPLIFLFAASQYPLLRRYDARTAQAADQERLRHAVDAHSIAARPLWSAPDATNGLPQRLRKRRALSGWSLWLMPTRRMRVSPARSSRNGASSWQGKHHDAHTLTRVTCPRKSAAVIPGIGLPSRSRPATGGRSISGAGLPDQGRRDAARVAGEEPHQEQHGKPEKDGEGTSSRMRPPRGATNGG